MKNKKIDKIFALAMLIVCFALIVDSFTSYDATKTILCLIMIFCWDASDTLRRLYNDTKEG